MNGRMICGRDFTVGEAADWTASLSFPEDAVVLAWWVDSWCFSTIEECQSRLSAAERFRVFWATGELRGRRLERDCWRLLYGGERWERALELEGLEAELSLPIDELTFEERPALLWGRRDGADTSMFEAQIPQVLNYPKSLSGSGRPRVVIEDWKDPDSGQILWSRWRRLEMVNLKESSHA
jgi:hypothetical protein